jgi:CRP-like cAMP-binding protein
VIEQLASASEICPLPAGVDVVVQGAPAHAFYAVMEGGVVVRRDGADVAELGPGDHFGERGLLDNAPRNATVTTVTASTLLRLEGDVLLEALQAAPAMWTTLDRSNVRGRSSAPHTALVDDPAWSQA